MSDLRFSHRWLWRVSSSGIWRRVVRWVSTYVLEEHIASIFRVEETGSANQRLRPWRWRRYVPPKRRLKLNGLHGVISQKMILFKNALISRKNHRYILQSFRKIHLIPGYFTFLVDCRKICNRIIYASSDISVCSTSIIVTFRNFRSGPELATRPRCLIGKRCVRPACHSAYPHYRMKEYDTFELWYRYDENCRPCLTVASTCNRNFIHSCPTMRRAKAYNFIRSKRWNVLFREKLFLTSALDGGVVNFKPLPLYPREKSPRQPLDRRLGGLQSRSGRCEEKKILHCRQSNPGRPARQPVAIPTSTLFVNTILIINNIILNIINV
jgi:hypothetical protein